MEGCSSDNLPATALEPSGAAPSSGVDDDPPANAVESGKRKTTRKPRKMNISTAKFHALGHYPTTIRHFGPSDLYSTEWGENFHRSPKAWFKSTSKKFIRKELSMHERRRKRLRRVKYLLLTKGKSAEAQELREQRLASRNPDIHHYIGTSKRAPIYLTQFSSTGTFAGDRACLHFIRNAKKHLLPRFVRAAMPNLEGQALQDMIQRLDWSNIVFKDDRIYTHKIMRVKYTTYDARRDEDIIHLDTEQCNVLFLNQDYSYGSSSHPFSYGKVIGILHAEVGYVGDFGRQGSGYFHYPIEFLWIRHYRVDSAGSAFELDQVELLSVDEPASHSFVDPLEVVRACHIVPNFHERLKYADMPVQGISVVADEGSDWKRYFVNRFVDRDMFIRYEWGLGVGHTYAYQDATAANLQVQSTYGSPEEATTTTTNLELIPSAADSLLQLYHERRQAGLISSHPDGGEEDGEEDGEGDGENNETDSEEEDPRRVLDPEYDSEVEKELMLLGAPVSLWTIVAKEFLALPLGVGSAGACRDCFPARLGRAALHLPPQSLLLLQCSPPRYIGVEAWLHSVSTWPLALAVATSRRRSSPSPPSCTYARRVTTTAFLKDFRSTVTLLVDAIPMAPWSGKKLFTLTNTSATLFEASMNVLPAGSQSSMVTAMFNPLARTQPCTETRTYWLISPPCMCTPALPPPQLLLPSDFSKPSTSTPASTSAKSSAVRHDHRCHHELVCRPGYHNFDLAWLSRRQSVTNPPVGAVTNAATLSGPVGGPSAPGTKELIRAPAPPANTSPAGANTTATAGTVLLAKPSSSSTTTTGYSIPHIGDISNANAIASSLLLSASSLHVPMVIAHQLSACCCDCPGSPPPLNNNYRCTAIGSSHSGTPSSTLLLPSSLNLAPLI
ncbi:hypothetical protein NMY22_g12062 [Coprinellus aureogranulatus]|nr:hypothetical protein NMY22_g12062 [Coprinellus aureogranulatus]